MYYRTMVEYTQEDLDDKKTGLIQWNVRCNDFIQRCCIEKK